MDQENLNANNSEQSSDSKSGFGALVGAIIIIILLALGAFYFWGAKLNTVENPPPLILGNDTASADISSDTSAGFPPQQTSDEADAIEADLQAMDLSVMDTQANVNMTAFAAETQTP